MTLTESSNEKEAKQQETSNLLTFRFALICALLYYLSAEIHETGHWLAAILLGANFALGFNRWEILSETTTSGQRLVILASGPATTLVLIAVGAILSIRLKQTVPHRISLLLLFYNSLLLLVSNLLGVLPSGMGDSGWMAYYLGVSKLVIILPFVLVAISAMILGLRMFPTDLKAAKPILLLVIVFGIIMGLIIVLDRLVWVSYETGQILFPVLGVSAITVIVNAALFILFLLLIYLETSRNHP